MPPPKSAVFVFLFTQVLYYVGSDKNTESGLYLPYEGHICII